MAPPGAVWARQHSLCIRGSGGGTCTGHLGCRRCGAADQHELSRPVHVPDLSASPVGSRCGHLHRADGDEVAVAPQPSRDGDRLGAAGGQVRRVALVLGPCTRPLQRDVEVVLAQRSDDYVGGVGVWTSMHTQVQAGVDQNEGRCPVGMVAWVERRRATRAGGKGCHRSLGQRVGAGNVYKTGAGSEGV